MGADCSAAERPPFVKIEVGHEINAVTFSANGDYLISGGREGVRVWRAQDHDGDSEQILAAMEVGFVYCVAVSKDGRWIAAGTVQGDVLVWDAETHAQVFATHLPKDLPPSHATMGVDFSPDSTRLVTASAKGTARVWDTATHKLIRTLDHDHEWLGGAKYAPQGNRIATATQKSLRIWDSNNGLLLAYVPVDVHPWYNTGILWYDNHLFVISNNKIKEVDASTGATVSDWPIPEGNALSCISLPQHGKFIAYSARDTITFWDTSVHTQLNLIQHSSDICSITLSPDGWLLAIGGVDGTITTKHLSHIIVSFVYCCMAARLNWDATSEFSLQLSFCVGLTDTTSQEPEIHVNDIALDSWKHGDLAEAEVLLTAELPKSQGPTHHILASRALVRTRLRQWDAAIDDAEQVHATLLLYTLPLTSFTPSLSRFSPPSLATLQKL